MKPVGDFQRTRRNLPHWQNAGPIYFVTWRTTDGVTLTPNSRTLALDAIRFWDGRRWHVYAAVVMPDHIHVLPRPLPVDPERSEICYDLAELLQSIKGFSARAINKQMGRTGSLWQEERYDRLVRNPGEFEENWTYIRNNPVKAGLVERAEDYQWFFEKDVAD